jgi:hypothetical protein
MIEIEPLSGLALFLFGVIGNIFDIGANKFETFIDFSFWSRFDIARPRFSSIEKFLASANHSLKCAESRDFGTRNMCKGFTFPSIH